MGKENSEIDFSFVLASSVHDMKNSLGMLLNTLGEVMEKYPAQNQEQSSSYAVLEYEAARINSELIQLLSLYRLDHDRIRVHVDEHFVVDTLNDQIARNHMLMQTRAIQLELDCDDNLQAYFDSDLIGGVINNVLVNCARYCKKKICISAQQGTEGLCITIEDDGPGYPADMMNDNDEPGGAIGFSGGRPHLGLLFANKVALMHKMKDRHGFIRLSNNSRLGGGCFGLYLP